MKYFTFDYSDRIMFNYRLPFLFGMAPRNPKGKFTQKHKDLAATVQSEYEYLFFKLLNKLQSYNLSENICLSGGCAYNGTANGKILKDTKFKNLWIPPAPSDAGSSIGAALDLYYAFIHLSKGQLMNYLQPLLCLTVSINLHLCLNLLCIADEED